MVELADQQDSSSTSPVISWRADRSYALASGLTFGLATVSGFVAVSRTATVDKVSSLEERVRKWAAEPHRHPRLRTCRWCARLRFSESYYAASARKETGPRTSWRNTSAYERKRSVPGNDTTLHSVGFS